MFGLEKAASKKQADKDKDLYDFEVRVRNLAERRKLTTHIKNQTQQLKTALRKGENQEEYDQLGLLLSSYIALDKLVEKIVSDLSRTKK